MSHQIITKMKYNIESCCIETLQHSNNVYPKSDHCYAMDVSSDEKMYEFIRFFATGVWQSKIWKREFDILFREFPEMRLESYVNELQGKSWEEQTAIMGKYDKLAQSKYKEIVARFKQLVKIRPDDFIKIPNREIAIKAFDYLRCEQKTAPALRLAHHLLHYERISLGIGEVDWEIDMALQRCGGNPQTGYRYTAHFNFNSETKIEKEKYEKIFQEKE